MRKIAVAVMFALIAGPALAQDHVPQYREEPKEKTAVQKADEKRAEGAYQRSLSNVPDQKPVDLAIERIRKIIDEVEKRGVQLMVGFNRRFDHNFQRVHDALVLGALPGRAAAPRAGPARVGVCR